mgnify:CR=1 FL=1
MVSYLTYERYKQLGGTLDDTAFTLAEFKARKRVDYLTASRVQKMANVPEAVTLCVFALIGLETSIGAESQISSPLVTSYNGNIPTIAESDAIMNKTVRTYLTDERDDKGTPLLYRGVYG